MSTRGHGLDGRQPQAVLSALAVLRLVADLGPGVSAKDVHTVLGIAPATAYTLLNLLVSEGYLARTVQPPGFALGPECEDLIAAATNRRNHDPSTESGHTW